MAYVVEIEWTSECPTAVVKTATTWREFPSLWPTLLDEVWAFLRARPGLSTNGHNVMVYRHGIPEVAVEVGVQVTAAFETQGHVEASTLPATEAAVPVHPGPPEGIGAAYEALRNWCAAHGRTMADVRWEIYGDPDPKTGQFAVAVHWELA